MVVDYFRLRLFFIVTKCDFPQFNRLVSRGCDQHLLVTIFGCANLLAEYVCNVVFVRRKLLHCCTLIETEEVDLVVHACEGVRALTECAGSSQTTLGDKEALLGLQVRRAYLLDKTVHRSRHAH